MPTAAISPSNALVNNANGANSNANAQTGANTIDSAAAAMAALHRPSQPRVAREVPPIDGSVPVKPGNMCHITAIHCDCMPAEAPKQEADYFSELGMNISYTVSVLALVQC